MPARQPTFIFGDEIDVSLLTSAPEDQWFDRKSARIRGPELAETVAAMANADGGTVAVGIHNGQIEGCRGRDQNDWRQAPRTYLEPPVPVRFEVRAARNARGEDDEIVLIDVEASDQVHRTRKGDVYLRVGDENRKLRDLEVRELEYDKGQSIFDARPVPGTVLEDLDPGLIDDYIGLLQTQIPVRDVLVARGLVTLRDGQPIPTTAGMMLFGRSPQQFFPEAWVRVVFYAGTERGTGARSNVRSDRRFEGVLGAQVDAAREHLLEHLPRLQRLGSSGKFDEVPLLPEAAWLEALVNAVIHRSYSMSGDHIRIEVFDDRLEVESPGRLPGLVREDNLRATRFARNPRIARVMADLGYGRELGEGVDRMYDEMGRAGLPDPQFEQRPASFRVELLAHPDLARLLATLPPWLAPTLEALSRHGPKRTGELADILGQTRPTVLRNLRQLAALGHIERIGGDRDPRAVWRLAL